MIIDTIFFISSFLYIISDGRPVCSVTGITWIVFTHNVSYQLSADTRISTIDNGGDEQHYRCLRKNRSKFCFHYPYYYFNGQFVYGLQNYNIFLKTILNETLKVVKIHIKIFPCKIRAENRGQKRRILGVLFVKVRKSSYLCTRN